MKEMKLIVGLGNPGLSYQNTRHNVGAAWVSDLARDWRYPKLKLNRKFQSLLGQGQINGRDVTLALPQTYMNLSGAAVGELVRFYKLDPTQQLLLVYDDLDLPVGRYKFGRCAPKGHNGVMSVQQNLDGNDWAQLRLGIDDRNGARQIPSQDYVLQNMPPAQLKVLIDQVFPASREEVLAWL
jgi:PTH1 family peptidyl-tRNA hydrolase